MKYSCTLLAILTVFAALLLNVQSGFAQCFSNTNGPSGNVACNGGSQTISVQTTPGSLGSAVVWSNGQTGASIAYQPNCDFPGPKTLTPCLPAGTSIPNQQFSLGPYSGGAPTTVSFEVDNICYGSGITYSGFLKGSVNGSGNVEITATFPDGSQVVAPPLPVGTVNSYLQSADGFDVALLFGQYTGDPNGTWSISLAGGATSYSINATTITVSYPNGLAAPVCGSPITFNVIVVEDCPTFLSATATEQVCSGDEVEFTTTIQRENGQITTSNNGSLTYIITGDNGFSYTGIDSQPTDNPTNATCAPVEINYSLTVQCTDPITGNVSNIVTNEQLTVTVYPEINPDLITFDNTSSVQDPGCAVVVIAPCPDFTVNGDLGQSSQPFGPGDNGTLGNFTISNGFCDYTFNIPVTCIGNCAPPTTNIITECQGNNSFQISITITDLGGSSALSLVPSQGAAVAVTAPGEYILGPFPNGTIVNVKSLNAADAGCNVNLGNFTENCDQCPTLTGVSTLPGGTNFCANSIIQLRYTATGGTAGTDFVVQWQLDGVDIPGATGNNYPFTVTASGCQVQAYNFTARLICLNGGSAAATETLDLPTINVYPEPKFNVDFFAPADGCNAVPVASADCAGLLNLSATPSTVAESQTVSVSYNVSVIGAPASCAATGEYPFSCPIALCNNDAGDGSPAEQTVCFGETFGIFNTGSFVVDAGFKVRWEVTNANNGNVVATYGDYENPGNIQPSTFTNDGNTFAAGNSYCFTPSTIFDGTDVNGAKPGVQDQWYESGSFDLVSLNIDGPSCSISPACGCLFGIPNPADFDCYSALPGIGSANVTIAGVPFCPGVTSYDITIHVDDNTSLSFTNPFSQGAITSDFPPPLAQQNDDGTYTLFNYTGNPNGKTVNITAVYLNPFATANVDWYVRIVPSNSPTYPLVCPSCHDIGQPSCVTLLPNLTVGNIAAPAPVCIGETINLTDLEPTASQIGTFTWYEGDPETGASAIDQPDSVVLNANTTFYLNFTTNEGGCSETQSVTYTTLNAPVLTQPVLPAICVGESINLNALNSQVTSQNGTFTWYLGEPGAGGAPLSNPNNVTPVGSEKYYVVFTGNATGCSSQLFVTANYNATPILFTQADAVCVFETINLTDYEAAIQPNAGTFIWYNGDPNTGGTVLQPNANGDILVIQNNTLPKTYYVSFTDDASGCSSTGIGLNLIVNGSPDLNNSPLPTAVCVGTTVDLTEMVEPLIITAETGDGTFAYFVETTPGISTPLADATAYVVTAGELIDIEFTSTATGCTRSVQLYYPINPAPELAILPNQTFCAAENVVDLTSVQTDLTTETDVTFAWYDGDPAAGGQFLDPTNPFNNPSEQTIAQGTCETYFVVATDEDGCTSQASVTFCVLNEVSGATATYDCDFGLQIDFTNATGGSGTYQVSANSPNQAGDLLAHEAAWTVIVEDSLGCQQDTLSGVVDCPICEAGAAIALADNILCCDETATFTNTTAELTYPDQSIIAWAISPFENGAVNNAEQVAAAAEMGWVYPSDTATNNLTFTRDCGNEALPAGHYLITPFIADRPVPCEPSTPLVYDTLAGCVPKGEICPSLSGPTSLITNLSITFPDGSALVIVGDGGILPQVPPSLYSVLPCLGIDSLFNGNPNGEWCITLTNGGTGALTYDIADFDVTVLASECTLIDTDQIVTVPGMAGTVAAGATESICIQIPPGGDCATQEILYDPAANCDPVGTLTPDLAGSEAGWEINPMLITFPDGSTINVAEKLTEQLIGTPTNLPINQTLLCSIPQLNCSIPPFATSTLYTGNPNGTWVIQVTNTGTGTLNFNIPDFDLIVSADSCTLITEDQITTIEGISGTVAPGTTGTFNLILPPVNTGFPTVDADCEDYGTPTDFYVLDDLTYELASVVCVDKDAQLYEVTVVGLSGGAVGIVPGASYDFPSGTVSYNSATDAFTFQTTFTSFPATFNITSTGAGITSNIGCSVLPITLTTDPCICIPPLVGFTTECIDENTYRVLVNIATLGSSESYSITDNQGSAPVTGITTAGLYQIGVYSNDVPAIITVVTEDDEECNVTETLTADCTQCHVGTPVPSSTQVVCEDETAHFDLIGTNLNNEEVEHIIGWALGFAPFTTPADTISMLSIQPANDDNSFDLENDGTYPAGFYYLTPFIAVSPGDLPDAPEVTYSPGNGCVPTGSITPNVSGDQSLITYLNIDYPAPGGDTTIVGPGATFASVGPALYGALNTQALPLETLYAGNPNGEWCITLSNAGTGPLTFSVPSFNVVVDDASCTLISGGDEVWVIPALSGVIGAGETEQICFTVPTVETVQPSGFPSFDDNCSEFGEAIPVIITDPVDFDLSIACNDQNGDGLDDSYLLTVENLSGGAPEVVSNADYFVGGFTEVSTGVFEKIIPINGAGTVQTVTVSTTYDDESSCEATETVAVPTGCLTNCQPTATFNIDCPETGNSYFVSVNISDFGGLNTSYTVSQGETTLTTITTATTQPVSVGPFTGTSPIVLTLTGNTSACTLQSGSLVANCCNAGVATISTGDNVLCNGENLTVTATGATVNDGFVVGWAVSENGVESEADLDDATLVEPSTDGTNNFTLNGNDLEPGVYQITPFISLAGDAPMEVEPCLPYDPAAGCISSGTTTAHASGASSLISFLQIQFPDGSDSTFVPGTLPLVPPSLYSVLETLPLSLQSLYPGDPNGEWCVTITNAGTGPLDFSLESFDLTLSAAECTLISEDRVFTIEEVSGIVAGGETTTICFTVPPAGACPEGTGGGGVGGGTEGVQIPCPDDCIPTGSFTPSLEGSEEGWAIFPMLISFPDGSSINVAETLTEQLLGSPLNIPINQGLLCSVPALNCSIPAITTSTLYDGNPAGTWTISLTNTGTGDLAFAIPDFTLLLDADSCDAITEDQILNVEGISGTVLAGQTGTFALNIPEAVCEEPAPSNFPTIDADCNHFGDPITVTVTDPMTFTAAATCNDTNGNGFGDNYLITVSNLNGGAPDVTNANYVLPSGFTLNGSGNYTTTLPFGTASPFSVSVGSSLAGDCAATVQTISLPNCPIPVCQPTANFTAICQGDETGFYVAINLSDLGDLNTSYNAVVGSQTLATITATGTTIIGPFTGATTVVLLGNNSTCPVSSASLLLEDCGVSCTAGVALPSNAYLCCGQNATFTAQGANFTAGNGVRWAVATTPITNEAELATAISTTPFSNGNTYTFTNNCSLTPGLYYVTPYIEQAAGGISAACESFGVSAQLYLLPAITYEKAELLCNDPENNVYTVAISGLTGGAPGLVPGASYVFNFPATYDALTDTYFYEVTIVLPVEEFPYVFLVENSVGENCGLQIIISEAPDCTPNNAPSIQDVAVTVEANSTGLDFNLLTAANASDPDGDALTLVEVGSIEPEVGTLTFDAAGNIVFVPANGFVGIVTMPFLVSDGTATVEGTLTITVNQVDLCGQLSPIEIVDISYSVNPTGGTFSLFVVTVGGFPTNDPLADYTFTIAYGDTSFVFTADGEDSHPYISLPLPTFGSTMFDVSVTITDETECSLAFVSQSIATTVVPIELLDFSGEVLVEGNQLNWTTATERDNDHFTLLRSTDGTNFTPIATLPGAGNTNTLQRYDHLDANAPTGLSYYRLMQTDFNGTTTTAGQLTLQRAAKGLTVVQLLPVPTTDVLQVVYTNDRNTVLTATVYDVTGKEVLTQTLESNNGLNVATLDVSHYPSGVYFLRLNNGVSVKTVSFVKE